jgi:DNA-binding SARP family transcriptional activator
LDAYLAGDSLSLRSNWAETYVNLSRRVQDRGDDAVRNATALLDSALIWDDKYLPAMVRYATVLGGAGKFDAAESWLARAEAVDAWYAPIQTAYADLAAARTRSGALDPVRALEIRIAHYRRALELEEDLAERAQLNARLRQDLADHGLIPEAIRVAEHYADTGPEISTYLRDRRDEALAYALELKAASGYAQSTLREFQRLVSSKPFNYQQRMQSADALAAAGQGDSAVAVLETGQRVLRAAGQPRADYAVRIAELHLRGGRAEEAARSLQFVLSRSRLPSDARLVRVLAGLGQVERAQTVLDSMPPPLTPAARAEHSLARAALLTQRANLEAAEEALRDAVRQQPYHVEARLALLSLLVQTGRREDAASLAESWPQGPLPSGPDYRRRAGEILRGKE